MARKKQHKTGGVVYIPDQHLDLLFTTNNKKITSPYLTEKQKESPTMEIPEATPPRVYISGREKSLGKRLDRLKDLLHEIRADYKFDTIYGGCFILRKVRVLASTKKRKPVVITSEYEVVCGYFEGFYGLYVRETDAPIFEERTWQQFVLRMKAQSFVKRKTPEYGTN